MRGRRDAGAMAERGTRPRVVVTGFGALTPLGHSVDASWEAIRAGRSGIGVITHFDASALPSRIAGEVKGFDPGSVIGAKQARRSGRATQLAIAAAREAVAQSGLDVRAEGDDIGVCIGSGIGGIEVIEAATRTLDSQGPRRVWPFAASAALVDTAPGSVAIDIGARGPNAAVVTACASGADALGHAAMWIRQGSAIAVLAGGTEAGITATGMAMFAAARALSTRNDDPEHASRPFDRDRDGFVASEGSAILVLEERDHALARGAVIHAEILGYGSCADAYHITAPDPSGAGAIRCMTRGLADAGIGPAAIDYINAHGTGTDLNDVSETRAIRAVFGEHADAIPVSSTKSMTGHLLGAAGAFEALVCILAIRDGFVPATTTLSTPADGCDLDYVPGRGRPTPLSVAMSTSFGFGGHNACLIIGRP